MSRQDDLKKLISEHYRHLQILKEQEAGYGSLNVPSYILTQIQDREAQIEQLQTELAKLEKREAPSTRLPERKPTSPKLPQRSSAQQSSEPNPLTQKLLTLARNPLWQMLGILVAVIGVAWSVYTFYAGGNTSTTPTTTLVPSATITASAAQPVAIVNSPSPVPLNTPFTPSTGVGSTRVRDADGMTMVYVPAGTFQMGSSDNDPKAADDEKPQHTVTLDAFWLDRTEVTVEMFAKFVQQTGYQTTAEKEGGGYLYNAKIQNWELIEGTSWQKPLGPDSSATANHPVVQVTWNDAAAYCRWADGRLPTEAEWEYAVRGPEGWIYPWGNEAPSDQRLNYNDQVGITTPVGSYPAGASWVGALDVAGNVWERVSDWYGTYPAEAQTNPTGPNNGDNLVLRGGSYRDNEDIVRAAIRYDREPDFRDTYVGFRCVFSPGRTNSE